MVQLPAVLKSSKTNSSFPPKYLAALMQGPLRFRRMELPFGEGIASQQEALCTPHLLRECPPSLRDRRCVKVPPSVYMHTSNKCSVRLYMQESLRKGTRIA
mmetsp:Transcript_9561/g.15682  ORF Transcript_9561/g.15682 Transcript_9561/m.15682 type:complete len:101 (-) Transcript_9561:1038-1340(-)